MPFIVAMIVPTGIGARIGGFGGDASPWLNVLAACCDVIITHPNVANAAAFQHLPANALYVEGAGLDRFVMGDCALRPVRANRVGVILDAGLQPRMRMLHRNVVNAVRTVYGAAIAPVIETAEPLRLGVHADPSGAASGSIGNLETLLSAGRQALTQGAQALAVVARMPTEAGASDAYKAGDGVDPIAGLEALLSHAVSEALNVPCAHAPAFDEAEAAPEMEALVDPRAASEFIVSTFLPCVLTGLARAPQYAPCGEPGSLSVDALSALVTPADALGGAPVWRALELGIPVLAVQENTTRMRVDAAALGNPPGVLRAGSYFEAAGMLQAMRMGLASAFFDAGGARLR